MWVKIDDNLPDHPKVLAAGPLAGWLFVCGLAYCNRYLTDGLIPSAMVGRLADIDDPAPLAGRLVEAGLWIACAGGYKVHDYLEYQPSARKIRARREANRRRAAAYRASKRPGRTGAEEPSIRSPRHATRHASRDANGAVSHDAHTRDASADRHRNPVPDPDPINPSTLATLATPPGGGDGASAPVEASAGGSNGSASPATRALRAIPKPKEVEQAAAEAHPLYAPLVTLFGPPSGEGIAAAYRADLAALVELGATPDEIPRRAVNYRAHFGADPTGRPIVLTRAALVRHWHLCARPPDEEAPATPAGGFREAGAVTWARRNGYAPASP